MEETAAVASASGVGVRDWKAEYEALLRQQQGHLEINVENTFPEGSIKSQDDVESTDDFEQLLNKIQGPQTQRELI